MCRPIVCAKRFATLSVCNSSLQAGSSVSDRAALVAFYKATNGPRWKNNGGWDTDIDVCHWDGVDVDIFGRVCGLKLPDNGVEGVCVFVYVALGTQRCSSILFLVP